MLAILTLIIIIVILGAVCYYVNRATAIPQLFKVLVFIICAIVAVWLVVHFFGIDTSHAPTLK